jgi:hypothetical protein
VALLTRGDLQRHKPLTWACLVLLAAVAAALWVMDRRGAAMGTLAALVGCLGLVLPPRERMAALPARLRRLPRSVDAAPILATLLSSPGYGLNWFHGANPYDEVVHLLSGMLAGVVVAALLMTDGRRRSRARLGWLGLAFGLGLGVAWEVLEWVLAIIGNWTDTWTDVALTALGSGIGTAVARRPAPRRDAAAA